MPEVSTLVSPSWSIVSGVLRKSKSCGLALPRKRGESTADFVEQAVLHKSVGETSETVLHDVLAGLLLEQFDLSDDVAANDGRVVPLRLVQRR